MNGVFECASSGFETVVTPGFDDPPPAPAATSEWTPEPTPVATSEWTQEPNTASEAEEPWVEPEKRSNGIPNLVGSGSFQPLFPAGPTLPERRLEACIAVAGGNVYLIGGIGGTYPVGEFDPVSSEWTLKQTAPREFHHHQCVTYGSNIYLIGAWYGNYPTESSHEETWVYNTWNDSWFTLAGLPEWRRRGCGAAAIYGSKIYFAAGSRGGYGWNTQLRPYLDVLDLENLDAGWVALPDLPNARDHTQGGIAGGYFCIAGGRDGSQQEYVLYNDSVLGSKFSLTISFLFIAQFYQFPSASD